MFSYTSITAEAFLRLMVAAFLGGLIGLEREFHGRPTGLRTHILVSLGAVIIMGSSQIFEESFMLQGANSVFRIDPGRISAGVVTGIGFLGAGAIVRSHDIVRGLTTAACICFAAAVGIFVGFGLGKRGSVLILVVLLAWVPAAWAASNEDSQEEAMLLNEIPLSESSLGSIGRWLISRSIGARLQP